MDFNEYQKAAQRTSNTLFTTDKLDNALLGLSGETGELCDLMKKYRYQGHGLDHTAFVKEAGDVLWYLAELATGLGVSLEHIAQTNIDKLLARYPDGFKAERSLHRKAGDI